MLDVINLNCLDFDSMKMMMFREYIEYTLKTEKPLSFQNTSRVTGISRKQWDLFRFENRDKGIKWLYD